MSTLYKNISIIKYKKKEIPNLITLHKRWAENFTEGEDKIQEVI